MQEILETYNRALQELEQQPWSIEKELAMVLLNFYLAGKIINL